MKKSTLFTFGFVLLLTLSIGSYFYLCSQSVAPQQTESTLELVQTSVSQLNSTGDQFYKIASTFQRLLAQ